jgi:hypothetical protein
MAMLFVHEDEQVSRWGRALDRESGGGDAEAFGVRTGAVRASAGASEAFRSFVAEAKVTGVNQATPPVAFVNGRLIRVDQLVDEGLSITFSGVDAENRLLLFKDRGGAVVSKRY